MLQRNAKYISSVRGCFRPLTLFLYFCLILSLTWYETSFSLSARITVTPTAIVAHSGDHDSSKVKQGSASRRLPSLRTSAPKLQSGARPRLDDRDDEFPPIRLCQALARDVPCLPCLRTDPVAWDYGTPSFLLPSAHGLVPFAIPPPFSLV